MAAARRTETGFRLPSDLQFCEAIALYFARLLLRHDLQRHCLAPTRFVPRNPLPMGNPSTIHLRRALAALQVYPVPARAP